MHFAVWHSLSERFKGLKEGIVMKLAVVRLPGWSNAVMSLNGK